jgi:SOS response regulatory protein OraA/RecX
MQDELIKKKIRKEYFSQLNNTAAEIDWCEEVILKILKNTIR